MTVWVWSEFRVTGPDREITRFRKLMFRTFTHTPGDRDGIIYNVLLDFRAIVPVPRRLADVDVPVWATMRWGTPSNCQQLELVNEAGGLLHFRFLTADGFPEPILRALAGEFPSLVFKGEAFADDGSPALGGQFNGDDRWGPWLLDEGF